MLHRALAAYFAICTLIASYTLLPFILQNGASSLSFIQIALYADIHIFCAAVAAILIWKNKSWGFVFALIPPISQVFRPIGDWAWLALPPPISLAWPFGDFSTGRGFLIDFLAITVFLLCLYGVFTKRSKTNIE
ncbi:hypothetical protein [uncultured Pseudoteredinibacter sp.]|uniref:hypothetical protein n=1 Tax=uncultured Pseudoteredinibacter sp. TaxID=1641701 RepID=UPI00261ED799|nr:hypothetical protein [uncultured Pseudoteredinibacter sp.]